jgi:hypothetical protein
MIPVLAPAALWPFYRAWREGFRDDPSGQRAFQAAVGETPGEAQAEWAAWLKEQRAPAAQR